VSAVLALLLSAFGLYGAMTESARQQRREIGIRIALGAPKWRVVRQVLMEAVRLAIAGTIAGTLGAVLVARWVMRMTPGAGPLGVGVWLAAPLVMTIVVAAASLLPARRALMVNPLASVRDRLQL
jgi:ABC-type antimicrobial peptide transport system permease subunit